MTSLFRRQEDTTFKSTDNSGNFPYIGAYEVAVITQPDHGWNPDVSTELESSVPVNGIVEVAGGEDWFSFGAGDPFSLETQLGTLPASKITLYELKFEPDFALVEVAESEEAPFGVGARLDYSPQTLAPFFAVVSGFSPTDHSGTYQLEMNFSGNDPDDQLGEALPVTVGQSITGSISEPTDVDLFAITVAVDETVRFDLDTPSPGLDSVLTVFDEFGNVLVQNDDRTGPAPEFSGSESFINLQFGTAGTYYIGVSSAGNNAYNILSGAGDTAGATTGEYRIDFLGPVAADADDQISEATLINVGDTVTDLIDVGDDVDMFAFNVAANQNVKFDLDTPNVALDSMLRLFDAAGNQIATSDDDPGPAPEYSVRESYIDFTFTNPGTYYVGVSSYNNIGYDARSGFGDVAGSTVGEYELALIGSPTTADGDFTGDGVMDGADIDLLIANIALGPADPNTFDMTGDGSVDLEDRDAWLAEAGAANLPSGGAYLLGDATLDGFVDVADFNAWNTYKFRNEAAWTRGDFNADGSVDVGDFNAWNSSKFMASDSAAAPLPSQSNSNKLLADAIHERHLDSVFETNHDDVRSRVAMETAGLQPVSSMRWSSSRLYPESDSENSLSRRIVELADLALSIWE